MILIEVIISILTLFVAPPLTPVAVEDIEDVKSTGQDDELYVKQKASTFG